MLEFHTLDVFTETPFAGNPLAVVLGADDLSTAQMQTIAREFNLSETIFVRAPRHPEHSAEVRIFFPTAEIPFAGHPTIGCAILLSGLLRGGEDGKRQMVLEERAGLVPVSVTRRDGRVSAEFTAPVLPGPAPGRAPVTLVARALGLERAELACGPHKAPALLQGGPGFLFVPVADTATLGRARPVEPFWSDLMVAGGVDSTWLYTPVGERAYRARMFAPTAGIAEDPATGSACAIFAAELLAAGLLAEGETRFSITQGVEMGRPSAIGLTARVEGDRLVAVRIAGSAVPISEGHVSVPAQP
jgi:trans-2,3-dihydro-3-hydroxyanthranilate isomerase